MRCGERAGLEDWVIVGGVEEESWLGVGRKIHGHGVVRVDVR